MGKNIGHFNVGRGIGREAYLLTDGAVKHQLHGDTAGHTYSLGHGGVTAGNAVLAHSAGAGLLGAVLVFDAKFVLEHDHVALLGAVLHLLLERGAKGVEGVAAGRDLLIGENTDPPQTRDDAVAVLAGGEGGLGRNGRLQVLLAGRGSAQDLLGGLLPGDGRVERLAGLVGQEINVHKRLDHLGESLVTESAADEVLGLRDVVALPEGRRVPVGVRNEGKSGVDVVGLGGGHEVGAGHAEFLAVPVELGGVAECKEHTTAGPRELVAERVVGAFGGGEATAVREEGGDLATLGVDLLCQKELESGWESQNRTG